VAADITWNVNQPGRWRRPQLVAQVKEDDVDWKRYLINRPYVPFDPRKFLEYRLFWPYSSGLPCQWMVHQIDIVHWYTDLRRPRSVVANGGIYFWKDGRQNYDTLAVVFDYGPPDDVTKGFQDLRLPDDQFGGTRKCFLERRSLSLDTARPPTAG
jgi:predicted dehydrogenase